MQEVLSEIYVPNICVNLCFPIEIECALLLAFTKACNIIVFCQVLIANAFLLLA